MVYLSTGPSHRGRGVNGFALEFNLVLLLVLPLGANVRAALCVNVGVVNTAVVTGSDCEQSMGLLGRILLLTWGVCVFAVISQNRIG